MDKNSGVKILAIEGAANGRLHQFTKAEECLERATELCQSSSVTACGDVIRARGSLAVQHGQTEQARQFFTESLQFARVHDEPFLEETALLNLGATALREGHFDEAIDWTDEAYRASAKMGADGEAQAALGNLGWAYYNLGDSERSLALSLEAEKRATQVGDVIDQLSWITNAGYVYASRGDFSSAKQSYLKALELATTIDGKEDIYNALRALALVSVESGDLEGARKYSDEALARARADNNRLDELYPLLVKGLVAAQAHEDSEAERIFREVERDPKANEALQWRSEHALAKLYEEQAKPSAADREYRAALATFEAARSSVHHNDSRLPFSKNAARIYDDYIHFLVARRKSDEALLWADHGRARTLAEGLGMLPKGDDSRPAPLNLQQVLQRAGGTILFYWLGQKQSYVWAITPHGTQLFALPSGLEIDAAVQRYRQALVGPQNVLDASDQDGRWLYRTLISPAQALIKKGTKVLIIPDGSLNNLNFETLLVPDPAGSPVKLHYWIEDVTIANASSLRMLATTWSRRSVGRRLLLVGNSIAPNNKYPELPKSVLQMESVARHFPAAAERIFAREQATPEAYLESEPEQFSHIHFVAHGTASRLSPLDSAIVLSTTAGSASSGENDSFKLYAREIIRHPLRAELVTVSACYGSGERTYSGEGLVGLSWAFLRAGARNVIAALWEVSDASTEQLMDKFYDEINKGASPDVALRTAKLSLLRSSGFHNPFYWAPFQLYAGSGAR